jgi:mRNA interferase RelE/StbE
MKYEVIITKSAQREIRKLPNSLIEKVIATILPLAENPRPVGSIKLEGSKNGYRIRIGDYRILYTIEDKIRIVEIESVKNRREAYN